MGSTTNGLNQLVNQGGTALSHDAKGNMTFDGARSFGYTAENRLVNGPGTNQYHDALGRLFHLSGSGVNLHHDGSAMIEEALPSGHIRRFVHGPGVDEPLVWYEGAGTGDKRYLHADERGSIVAVSDNAGNALAINRYDEYGKPQAGNVGRFQYTGQVWLPEIGLYYYKARMYNPNLSRFMQTDPIGYGDGMNLYSPMGGDPVNLTDPMGLASSGRTICTGTRISSGCGPGGIGNSLSGFSTAGPGGQYATGEGSLNAMGVKTGGMSGAEMRQRAGQFLQLGEALAMSNAPRDVVVVWGFGESNFSSVVLAGWHQLGETFGNNPRLSRQNPNLFPGGRMVSGRSGGFFQALSDFDDIARLNGITPPSPASIFTLPGKGWSISFSNGYQILQHVATGLTFRANGNIGISVIEIPVNARFGIRSYNTTGYTEHVHYRGW